MELHDLGAGKSDFSPGAIDRFERQGLARISFWSTKSASASTTRPKEITRTATYTRTSIPTRPTIIATMRRSHHHPSKYNFFNAAGSDENEYSQPPDYSAGPIWAIFDADAVKREGWKTTPPYVDPDGYFFSAQYACGAGRRD